MAPFTTTKASSRLGIRTERSGEDPADERSKRWPKAFLSHVPASIELRFEKVDEAIHLLKAAVAELDPDVLEGTQDVVHASQQWHFGLPPLNGFPQATQRRERMRPTGAPGGVRVVGTGFESGIIIGVSLNHYDFRSAWSIDADPSELFDALNDVVGYARWWPEIKEVVDLGDDAYVVVARSFLPYTLRFNVRPGVIDRDAGILETLMTGDLEGYSRWRLAPEGAGTRVVFEERVEANKKLLRRLALVGRPWFIANHALMMRHARRGMAVYMSGWRAAQAER